MPRILITGATGFLGGALMRQLLSEGRCVRVAVRPTQICWPAEVDVVPISGLEPEADWFKAVKDIRTLVHCAARVHVMRETAENPLEEFRRINVRGTINLARQAIASGVERFILISSIGVNGMETNDRPFCADDAASPYSPYAVTKWELEQELEKLGQESGLEVVVIRPPLIYGYGAPGNFSKLIRAVNLGVPFPFGRLRNLRSFAAIENVVDLIITCIDHPRAANKTFLVSDGEDISTTDFIRRIAKALGRPVCFLPIPEPWLENVAGLVGKRQQLRKITCSLQVDIEKTIKILSWKPVISVDDALEKSVLGVKKLEIKK